ncbi:MAG TPA: cytochrome c biogenesis protein CcsA [Lacipirellulaceae bacterium]|nr:cytochrome c biogenesis protein CcsA [Lacipirellulaceae bacterium]
MATSELIRPRAADTGFDAASPPSTPTLALAVRQGLAALASLRLTVVLFALAIFLIFVGTLAQKDHDVWEVVNHLYFNRWIAFVELRPFERLAQIFFKHVEWNLSGSFPFPGGKLIGILLLANLAAAHSVRFKVAAYGRRLAIGLATIAAGLVLTYTAIRSGMNKDVATQLSPDFCNLLWQVFRGTLAGLAIAGAYGVIFLRHRMRQFEWTVLLVFDVLIAGLSAWLLAHPEARLDDSGIRILWQLLKGGSAGVVLLTGCAMVFRKRAGIVLLHGGIALMMVGQLLWGISSQESRMTIPQGGTVGYSDDIRSYELAVIDHSPEKTDQVTVVPASLLINNVGQRDAIVDSHLPFKIQVHRWLQNSQIRSVKGKESNPATAGFGLDQIADAAPPTTGVGEDASKVDFPAAYIELISKDTNKPIGTFLTSEWLNEQPVKVDGHTYDIALRFKRIYHPYTLTLKKFSFDKYTGTNTAKNYSSLVEFKDPAHNIDREFLIWMNNPLRYEGTTFYQQSFDEATETTTVLQVVSNPSWMTPYVACMLVAIGMLAHFGVVLVRFLRRRAHEMDPSRAGTAHQRDAVLANGRYESILVGGDHPGSSTGWASFAKWFPALIMLIFAGYIVGKARMPKSPASEMQIFEFAKLPVAYQGRVKPYDTLARNALQIISTRQEVVVLDKNGNAVGHLPAIRWLLDAISDANGADDHPVFRIDNTDLVDALGMKHRPGVWRYSLNEIRHKPGELERQFKLAQDTPEKDRSLFQNKVLRLRDQYNAYMALVLAFRPPPLVMDSREKFQQSLERTQALITELEGVQAPHAVPPQDASTHWTMLVQAELEALKARVMNQPVNPATISLSKLLTAYADGDVATFNQQLSDYRRELGDYQSLLTTNTAKLKQAGAARSEILSQPKIDFEVFFNQFSPFYYAAVLYLIAFVLGVFSWIGWTEPLRRASMWLLWLTFALHTFALVARIYISGRPPITNLYSTAIFIGWAGVLMALAFEHVYRLGLGNISAAVIGFLTLVVAHNLSLDGDTFIVLQAVLDTQFWLATHVVTVNLGYAATYMAGLWGILYILLGHVFPVLNEETRHKLLRTLYGTLCFAIFFSFVGTVLGGLWADDSWGRFWGWDPKENGALMIVLWNALVLHARWGGLVKGRGLANLVIAGNIVVTWSYFGVNELGVGLHSYGASESSTAMWLLTFAASQLALVGLGLMPRRWFDALRLSRATA